MRLAWIAPCYFDACNYKYVCAPEEQAGLDLIDTPYEYATRPPIFTLPTNKLEGPRNKTFPLSSSGDTCQGRQ